MNWLMVKRETAASWKSLGVPFAEQMRTRGNTFRFCAEQILVASPVGSRLAHVRLLPAHSYKRRDWADGAMSSALFSISGMT
jgi:hypothetical protein